MTRSTAFRPLPGAAQTTLRTGPALPPLLPPPLPPLLAPEVPCRLVAAGPGLYRVLDSESRILGHLAILDHPLGARYRAQRYQPSVGAFRSLGDFWSAGEAVGCLRSA